jgi:hypothetical protein
MIRAVAVLILLAAAAGCAANDNTPQGQCRRQAYQDPAVQDAMELANSSMSSVRIPALMQQDYLVRQATERCLAAMGLAAPGGVEPLQPQ